MSEETDLLKSAVAHHGSAIVAMGNNFYAWRNAYNEATWALSDSRIPLAVQHAKLAKLEKASTWFFFQARMATEPDDMQPSGDEVLPASMD